MPSLLRQAIAFALVTLVVALTANALHPHGLSLTRDYFLEAAPEDDGVDADAPTTGDGHALEHEFQSVGLEEARDWAEFLYEPEGDVIFLDARRPARYREGHVPGAYSASLEDEEALDELMPRLRNASIVVVYCTGGDCEDSIFLARDLVYRHGLDRDLIWIFEGGWKEWTAAGAPVKEGPER